MREFHTDARRVDEVLEPVEYAISQDAESFHQVQDIQLRIAVADPFPCGSFSPSMTRTTPPFAPFVEPHHRRSWRPTDSYRCPGALSVRRRLELCSATTPRRPSGRVRAGATRAHTQPDDHGPGHPAAPASVRRAPDPPGALVVSSSDSSGVGRSEWVGFTDLHSRIHKPGHVPSFAA